MSQAPAIAEQTSVARLIDRAAKALAGAVTAAQVLDARDQAGRAYDEIKRQLRIHKAKRAHDDIIAAAHRAQADALEIETLADVRLADEIDAARSRGDLVVVGRNVKNESDRGATLAEIGITRKAAHNARVLRDAIARQPAGLKPVLDDILANGAAPTRTLLKRTLRSVLVPDARSPVGGTDTRPTLICGRLLDRVSFFEIEGLRERALAEARLLEAVAKHVANPAPDLRVGDAIGSKALADLVRQARGRG